MIRVLRIVAGVIVGHAAMIVLITLVQETWLGGVSYGESSLVVLGMAGLFTFLSAVVGGALAAFVSGPPRWIAPGVMCGLVVLETTALTLSGRLGGPLWFDVAAAGSLLAGILLGAAVVGRVTHGPTESLAT